MAKRHESELNISCYVSDEKVQLASQMYDLVSRYLRRLDQESHKFKLELEADHVGITELLEKREYLTYFRKGLIHFYIK